MLDTLMKKFKVYKKLIKCQWGLILVVSLNEIPKQNKEIADNGHRSKNILNNNNNNLLKTRYLSVFGLVCLDYSCKDKEVLLIFFSLFYWIKYSPKYYAIFTLIYEIWLSHLTLNIMAFILFKVLEGIASSLASL